MDERLQPGDGNAVGSPEESWKPCGRCDGVIYLGDIEAYSHETQQLETVSAGNERQALRYLADPRLHPEAAAWMKAHPGQLGLCAPSIEFLLNQHPEIFKAAEAAQRPIRRHFVVSQRSLNANQPEHIRRWHLQQVEEGIWVVWYV